jgi:hypothetical protein
MMGNDEAFPSILRSKILLIRRRSEPVSQRVPLPTNPPLAPAPAGLGILIEIVHPLTGRCRRSCDLCEVTKS